jgi:hypothetical protein
MTRLLKTPIIGRNAAPVASSWSDMLAGLSKKEILRMPPDFWANAFSAARRAISNPPPTAKPRTTPIIPSASLPPFAWVHSPSALALLFRPAVTANR